MTIPKNICRLRLWVKKKQKWLTRAKLKIPKMKMISAMKMVKPKRKTKEQRKVENNKMKNLVIMKSKNPKKEKKIRRRMMILMMMYRL